MTAQCFNTMSAANDPPEAILTRNPMRVRTDYRASIEYSLSSLISYVETYGDDNLVVIFLGDHQPSPIVTGQGRQSRRTDQHREPRPVSFRSDLAVGLADRA